MTLRSSETAVYLFKSHTEQFTDVHLVSRSGDRFEVCSAMLACLSKILKKSLSELVFTDVDVFVIKTDYESKDLEMVVNFVMEGLLPKPIDSLIGDQAIMNVFKSFGISLEDLLFKKSDIKTEVEELFEVSDQVKLENVDALADVISSSSKSASKKRSRKSLKRKVKKEEEAEEPSDEDDNAGYFDFDIDWALPAAEHKSRTSRKTSPAKKIKIEPESMANHLEYILKVQEEYKNTIAFSVPEVKEVDMAAFEGYELSTPLQSFLKGPKKLPKSDENSATFGESKPFACDLCLRGFSSKMTLMDHENTYHNDHFQCTYCRRVFAHDKGDAFKVHMFKHEYLGKGGDHECINCGFKSSRIYVIKNHIKSMGPYHNNQCTLCPMAFSSHDDFKSHVAFDHGGKKLYRCGRCPETFKEYKDCSKHQSKVHG